MNRGKESLRIARSACESCGHLKPGNNCGKWSGHWTRPEIYSRPNIFDAESSCPIGKWGPEKTEPEPPTPLVRRVPEKKSDEPFVWATGITTSYREKATLSRSLKSIERAGWSDVHVFADGECRVPYRCPITRRVPNVGAFSNWWLSLQELVHRRPEATHYALFQDDVILCRGARERVETLNADGVLSLYQSSHHASEYCQEFAGGAKFVGALALVIPREVAYRMVVSDLGLTHRLRKQRSNDYIDGGIGHWCRENKVPLTIHGPSLAQHIGETSTLGHREEPSSTFVGEHFDASKMPILKPDKRIGLVGFNTAQGLGYVNRDIAKFLGLRRWIVTAHSRFPMLDLPDGVDCRICPWKADDDDIRSWLHGLDVVVFVEVVQDNLPRIAQEMGIKTACIPMVEWLPTENQWTKHIDLWLAATLHSYNQLLAVGVKGEVAYCPWPIDVEAFDFRQRTRCERYVFAHGNGGPRDRKGGKIVAEAARLAPDVPLIVYSQVQDGLTSSLTEDVHWPKTVDFRGAVPSPADLYRDGDVFVLPSRWEGLGLQLFECQAAGMPLITTDAPPMNEANPWRRLPSTPNRVRLSHDYPSHDVSPEDLVRIMRENLGADIADASQSSREWVEERRDWRTNAEKIRGIILGD